MPLYFFHSYGAEFIDRIGTELPNDACAHSEAGRLAGTMLRDDPQFLFAGRPFRTEVVSEAGECLFTIVTQAVTGVMSQAA